MRPTVVLTAVLFAAVAAQCVRASWIPSFRTCGPRPAVPASKVPLPATLVADIVAHLRNATLGPCTPGAHSPSATALSGGFVLQGQWYPITEGCSDKAAPAVKPSLHDTIFRLGSMSKTFVAEGALKAVRDGKIASLDDELRKYFPRFAVHNPFDDTAPTVRQMVSQLAGMASEPPCAGLPECLVDTATVLARVRATGELIFAPNSRPSYSNLAFGIIGNLLPRLWEPAQTDDAKAFPALLKNITAPLGMHDTGLNFTAAVRARMAVEYSRAGTAAPFTRLGFENPSGGIYSTGADMLRWVQHFLDDWAASPDRKQTLMPCYLNPDGQSGFGMPWEIVSSNGYLLRTKAGALDGVSTVIGLVPELAFGFALLWNGAGFDSTLAAKAVADAALPTIMRAFAATNAAKFPAVPVGFADAFVGNYSAGPGVFLTVDVPTPSPKWSDGNPVVYLSIAAYGMSFPLRPGQRARPPPASWNVSATFQVDAQLDALPCFGTEISNYGNWVYFSHTADGGAALFMPGVEWAHFPKVVV
jgi:CubicO group peptidase (beta-lactamase class C family)